jgi:hypothetical protein
MNYTCLSIAQPFASAIILGVKTIEVRGWSTKYRGPIMICSTARDFLLEGEGDEEDEVLPGGVALGLVDLTDVRPFRVTDCEAAVMFEDDFEEGMYAWVLENPRQIEPIENKGQQRLYHRDFDPVFV